VTFFVTCQGIITLNKKINDFNDLGEFVGCTGASGQNRQI